MSSGADSIANSDKAFTIRPARREDTREILTFIRELAEYEKLTHEVVADEEILERTLFDKPAAEVLFAELDGKPVGFALFFTNYSTFLGRPGIWLEDLFVRPAARGRGIGKALLLHLARLTVQRDGGRLDWAVLDWNTPAIDFYKSIGAAPLEGWTIFRLTGDALRERAEEAS